jgi:cell division protein FtsI/penicillin-binding protein 2
MWGESLRAKAIDQWTRELPIVAKRGNITDRNGVILASNYQTYSVFVRGRSVKDAKDVSSTLSSVLGVDESDLYAKITKSSSSVLTVEKRVDGAVVDKLRAYSLQGVYYSPDYTRNYPYGKSLSQVLGYTSYDGAGLTGIEKSYNEYLSGYDGEILIDDDCEWYCPNCGNRDHNLLNVARRTCGYIGSNFWNKGRTQEIKERVLHIDNKDD